MSPESGPSCLGDGSEGTLPENNLGALKQAESGKKKGGEVRVHYGATTMSEAPDAFGGSF